MTLLRLENAHLAFGEASLLESVNLQIERGERIFLIGRNGMGKSCLLRVLMGDLPLDSGKVFRSPNLKIAELSQNLPEHTTTLVYDVVAGGLKEVGELLKKYHVLTHDPEQVHDDKWFKQLEEVQTALDAKQGWHYQQKIENILDKLDLPADKPFNTLSGGWQRRVSLARALVCEPDLLLLDEPTNHLDLAAIQWLEDFLQDYPGAVLCITHDRSLLRRLSKRIIELDRGNIYSFEGDYDKYLEDKAHRLEVEETHANLFDKNLAKEEVWIRQGIKARRTRNEGRVRALMKLRSEREQRRELQGNPNFSSNAANTSGELVVDAENVSYDIIPDNTHAEGKLKDKLISKSTEPKVLVKNFTMRIVRGDKIAFVGPNGVGKSTLLKLLLGQLQPTTGKIKLGTQLQVGYFDQLRVGIDPELSALENVGAGREFITINGKDKHVISYLSDFLFTPQRIRTPVKMLSGGECNRLLLAKLFSLPTNLLVLDEPTNDLDIESLELLENILVEYPGTVLLVSHDRTFVDNVVSSTLYFRGEGKIDEFVGGYRDIPKSILAEASSVAKIMNAPTKEPIKASESIAEISAPKMSATSKAFSSKMQKELDELPNKIRNQEAEIEKMQSEMAAVNFYQQEDTLVKRTLANFEKNQKNLEMLYQRWEELEKMRHEI